MIWLAFFFGAMVGAVALVGITIIAGRWLEKRTIKTQGRLLPAIDQRTEAQLLEAMRSVARLMNEVPEDAIENGLAVSFGDDSPGYVVSVHRIGKKSFPELFMESEAKVRRLEKGEEPLA